MNPFCPQASREVDCIVLRLYEAFGGHAKAVVSSSLNFASVVRFVFSSYAVRLYSGKI